MELVDFVRRFVAQRNDLLGQSVKKTVGVPAAVAFGVPVAAACGERGAAVPAACGGHVAAAFGDREAVGTAVMSAGDAAASEGAVHVADGGDTGESTTVLPEEGLVRYLI